MSHFRKFVSTIIFGTVLIMLSTNGNASLMFFSDRTTWESALGGTIGTEDFNAVTPFAMSAGSNSAGQLDIVLTNLTSSFNSIDNGAGILNIDGTTYYKGSATSAENIVIQLSQAVLGFGADFRSTHSASGLTLEIDSIMAEFTTLLPSGDGDGFLGVISTNAFSSVRLFDASQNESFGLDNVSFGGSVPEPTTLALMGLGLAGIGWKRRKTA